MKTKERRHTKDIHQQFTISLSLASTDNKIGDTGATSLSESLKTNTTLTKLILDREGKRTKTHKKICISQPRFLHSVLFAGGSIIRGRSEKQSVQLKGNKGEKRKKEGCAQDAPQAKTSADTHKRDCENENENPLELDSE